MAFNNAIGVSTLKKALILKIIDLQVAPVPTAFSGTALLCKEVYKAIYINILGSQTV